MKKLFPVLGIIALAACGADGEPTRPSASAAVTINSSGVHTHAGVGLHKGPLSVYLGL